MSCVDAHIIKALTEHIGSGQSLTLKALLPEDITWELTDTGSGYVLKDGANIYRHSFYVGQILVMKTLEGETEYFVCKSRTLHPSDPISMYCYTNITNGKQILATFSEDHVSEVSFDNTKYQIPDNVETGFFGLNNGTVSLQSILGLILPAFSEAYLMAYDTYAQIITDITPRIVALERKIQ